MYALLKRYLPGCTADLLTAAWYAILFLLVVYFAFESQAEFIYLEL